MRINTSPRWRPIIDRFLEDAARQPSWRELSGKATVVVHGSATVGLADTYSDTDIQVVVPDQLYDETYADAVNAGHLTPGERLVLLSTEQATIDGRRPLCAAELRSISDLESTLTADLPVELWVMAHAWVIHDPRDQVASIVTASYQQFTAQLETLTAHELGHLDRRRRWLAIACQRGRHDASMAFLTINVVRSAMRLACLLDDSPIPYDKWLVAWTTRNTRLGLKLNNDCHDLLLDRVDQGDIDALSQQIATATVNAARDRWPHASWVSRPTLHGPVRS